MTGIAPNTTTATVGPMISGSALTMTGSMPGLYAPIARLFQRCRQLRDARMVLAPREPHRLRPLLQHGVAAFAGWRRQDVRHRQRSARLRRLEPRPGPA